MAKQITNQKHIYKIHSTRFRLNKWHLNVSYEDAVRNEEIVPITNNEAIRMIRKIRGVTVTEGDIFAIKREIKKLKRKENTKENREKIKTLHSDLNKHTLVEDYLLIVFDSIKDWKRATSTKEPFFFNGKQYVRLIGTNGGVKKNTVVFCPKEIHFELDKRMNNDRDKNRPYVPAKFESYKALTCSASTPVSMPKGVLVIKDGETVFQDKVIQLTDDGNGGFELNEAPDYTITRAFTDGCGMISKELSDKWAIDLGLSKTNENGELEAEYTITGFNVRNSWCKGMVFTFPFHEFAEEIAKSYEVKDVWGNIIDIRTVDLIITSNMLKLWDAYTSVEHYLKCCKKNDYNFSVAKVLPKELEKVRNMNYQFLQSYKFDDNDIEELIKPTVECVTDSISDDYRKSLLFLKGCKITENDYETEEYNFVKALMIEKDMINDPFIRQRIARAREKRMNDSKKGVLQVYGNYSIMSGDLYALCQWMFGMEVTGLLGKNEFYSYEWNRIENDDGTPVSKVVGYRAPMSNHNNIRILNLKNNADLRKWYRYMTTCIVFNAWDTSMDAFNGADLDGDAIITTNNKILLGNTINLPAIVCEQKVSDKKKIRKSLLKHANRNGFGNGVGGVTNLCTGMYDVIASFEEGTPEYNTMLRRIICMQGYQQEIIDSIKGIIPKRVPREWYSYQELKMRKTDSEEVKEKKENLLKLASLKKPYFFIYNYPQVMQKYKKFISDCNTNSLIRFGLTIDELYAKNNKEEAEIEFLKHYELQMPVFTYPSTMNRICWALEDKYKNLKLKVKENTFDTSIIKSGVGYSKSAYSKIEEIYKEYRNDVKQYFIISSGLNKEEKQRNRAIFLHNVRKQIFEVCNNEKEVCDIVIDMLYAKNGNKQFVWDICGDVIIENLLEKNNYQISYPVQDNNGDFEWCGHRYKMISKKVKDSEEEEWLVD